MERHDDNGFQVNPPPELDAMVFAKVAPVLKENRQIYNNKRWFQIWMPVASTAALTAFSFWFLNRKATQSPLTPGDSEVDLQTFAAMDMDEDSLELANNFELIEDLELLEAYSEDDENS